MECVPDLAFLQMAAASNSEMFNKMMWQTTAAGAAAAAGGGTMKQRKTNFTSREVEALLKAVADRKSTVLFGVAGGIGWARAWHEVAQAVSAVEGIHRSESDVRKKWTYLKWEAKNTSKPGRDPTSRAVLDILTSRDREAAQAAAAGNSLLEQLLVPGSCPGSPAPVAAKKSSAAGAGRVSPPGKEHQATISPQVTAHPQPSPTSSTSSSAAPEVCLRWNSYHSNMQAVFPSLLNNEQFVDVTLACEGRSIKCHKVMLSACSSYLEELLSQNPCQHPIVFMRDLKFWELQALVEFMYSGEVNVTQDKLPSLLAAADALQIKGLAGPFSGTTSSHGEEEHQSGENEETTAQFILNKRSRKRKSANPLPYIHQAHTPIGIKQTFMGSAPSKGHHHSSPPPLAQLPPRHNSPAPAVSQSAATPSSVRMSPPPATHAARSTPTPPVSTHSLKFHGSPRRPQSPQVVMAPSILGVSRTDSCSPGLSTVLPGPPHPYRPPADDDDEKPLALCTNNEPLNLGIDSKEHGSGKPNELTITQGIKEENGIRPIKEEMTEDDEDDDDDDDDEDDGDARSTAYE